MDKQALIEAVKEILRLALFAALGVAVSGLLDYFDALQVTEWWVVAFTAGLRWLDKYIHENKSIKAKGVAPF